MTDHRDIDLDGTYGCKPRVSFEMLQYNIKNFSYLVRDSYLPEPYLTDYICIANHLSNILEKLREDDLIRRGYDPERRDSGSGDQAA